MSSHTLHTPLKDMNGCRNVTVVDIAPLSTGKNDLLYLSCLTLPGPAENWKAASTCEGHGNVRQTFIVRLLVLYVLIVTFSNAFYIKVVLYFNDIKVLR